MNDFWQDNKKKHHKEKTQDKKRISLDGIKIKRNPTIEPQPIRKKSSLSLRPKSKLKSLLNLKINLRKKKLWLFSTLILIFLSFLIIGSFCLTTAAKNKLDVLKLFKNGKYLVLFQNNAEMRPSGGFIGSFAVIELNNFKLKNIRFNTNIYKLDQDYTSSHIIAPPTPLATIDKGKWSLRDANFAASFTDAAKDIEWFYNQETGESVDGVIALNASVVSDLLKITGPIKLANYDTEISADNFFTELTLQIEKNYYKNSVNRDLNEPKSILKDLFPELANRLFKENKIELVKFIYQEIQEKQILFYSNSETIEQAILAQNWGGEVQPSQGDYLSVINANIGGGKSSLNVVESLNYNAKSSSDGIVSDLKITRTHKGKNVWPDGVNLNYMRVLVPLGSSLNFVKLNNKDITTLIQSGEEAGKTYFAINTETRPGSSDVIELKYLLPLKDNDYQLLVQKQPGNLGDNLTIKFNDELLFDGILDTDKIIKTF